MYRAESFCRASLGMRMGMRMVHFRRCVAVVRAPHAAEGLLTCGDESKDQMCANEGGPLFL